MEDNNRIKILVPVDFTEVSEIAIKHAIVFAKITNAEINLLHVIQKPLFFIGKKHTYDNQLIEDTTISILQQMADDIETEHEVDVQILAVTGTIYETIPHVSSEIGAHFVFMGTHGVKGFQHIRGSNALRIIYHSSIPFILTQKKLPFGIYDNIVFPITIQSESAQKTDWAIYFSKIFSSKINLLIPNEIDKYLHRKIHTNLNYVKKIFEKNNITYTIKTAEKDSNSFAESINNYAQEIKANMIMIMIYPEKGSGEFFLTPNQQKIISNAGQVPVICINPGTIFTLKTIMLNDEE